MGFFSELAPDAKSAPPAEPRPAEPEPRTVIQPKPGPGESAGPEPAGETEPARETDAAEQARKEQGPAAEQELSDEDAVMLSVHRVRNDTERLTRRNMKDCVSEHVQDMCQEDPAFARRVLHPRKSMVNCFKYISRSTSARR